MLFILFSLSGVRPVPAATAQPYSVIVDAHYEGAEVSVPINLDGLITGFLTPHEFDGLIGYHNFSAPDEYRFGQFIQGPPNLQTDPSMESNLVAEGVNWIMIGSPNATNWKDSIEFKYGSNPFVENFRDLYQPGSRATLGIEVHMNPARIVQGRLEVYRQDWPVASNATPFYSNVITLWGATPSYVQFDVPKNGPAGTWAYRIRINSTDLQMDVKSSFDVDSVPAPVPENFAPVPALPYTIFEVAGTQFAMFENSSTSPVVLYVGGGIIGDAPGLTPIDGYSNVTDWNSACYRLVHDLVDHGFTVVMPSGPWHGFDFPSELVSYLRAEGKSTFFAIGHSAGGFVVANALVSHPSLFSRAVIADAPLTQESTGYYFTGLSIRSGGVRAPHLLVWGRGDNQASLENAYAWMDHANQSLARLGVYDYEHYWGGTSLEGQVREQIVSFLTGGIPMGGGPLASRPGLEDQTLQVKGKSAVAVVLAVVLLAVSVSVSLCSLVRRHRVVRRF